MIDTLSPDRRRGPGPFFVIPANLWSNQDQ
jgi:hypothetical protein